MGLFTKEYCPLCGKEVGLMTKSMITWKGSPVCTECIEILQLQRVTSQNIGIKGNLNNFTKEELASEIKNYNRKLNEFTPTKSIGNLFHVDENRRQFAVTKTNLMGKEISRTVYDYDDIIDYELLEDGNTIAQGGVGRALVGGTLFGGVGAIVGATTRHKNKNTCSKLQIKITLNNIANSVAYINYIEAETKKSGFVYKTMYNVAQETLSILNVICQSNKIEMNKERTGDNSSEADEIMKFKKLMDEGIITEEEFAAKKKQLLGL